MRRRLVTPSIVVLVATLVGVGVGALAVNAIETDFVDEIVFSGLNSPTNIEFAPDGRIFVTEKGGRVKVYDSLNDSTPDTFADLSFNVHDFWDRGLLGLAIHPDFPSTPYVYVLYTYDAPIGGSPPTWGDNCADPPGATDDGCMVSGRLSRLEAAGNSMTGSEVVLIEDWCQQYPSHSIGDLEFGADGALYVSAGDGASFNWEDYGQGGGDPGSPTPRNPCGDPPSEGGALRSQDLQTSGDPVSLDGTILRIDPLTGAAMPDNPVIGHSDPKARMIVANGSRNPFRMAVKPGTNEIFTGDVGWTTWEEVNVHPNPSQTVLNFGWPCYEGGSGISLKQPGYDSENLPICESLYGSGDVTAPLFAYDHAEDITGSDACRPANPPQGTSSSISGLDFYTGGGYPGTYVGALFGSDYSRDCIWVMFPDSNGDPDPSTVEVFQHLAQNPVDIERGTNGDIFYVNINGGQIRRLRFVGSNTPPQAVIAADPTSGTIPLDVDFDASGSSDADDDALSYTWDFDDDGQYDDGAGETPQWTFDSPGSHTVRLKATDARGESDTASLIINASNGPPVPVIDTPAETLTWAVGDAISFSGHADDPDEGTLPTESLAWRMILHHCENDGSCHIHRITERFGVDSGLFYAVDHPYPSWFELELTATDQYGSAVTTSILLYPKTVDLAFETIPSGLDVVVEAGIETAPYVTEVIVNTQLGISAPSPQQTLDNHLWEFVSWSDGGAQTHDIIAPGSDTTYTATFNRYPTIVGDITVDVDENSTDVHDLGATDDSDTEGSGLSYSVSGGDDQTKFTVDPATGLVSFLAPPDYENPTDHDSDGVYKVEIQLTDSGGLSDTHLLWATVEDLNETPTAGDDSYDTDEDTPLVVNAANGVLDDDSDPDGDTLVASLVGPTSHGDLILASGGSFSYIPDPGWNGTDQFTYEACDPEPLCDQATVIVDVASVNDTPSAMDDAYDGAEDTPVVVTPDNGLLDNDTDDDLLTASEVSSPAHGSLALSPDGSFTYTPNADWHGTDQFIYEACDPEPLCDQATVTIDIVSVNDIPSAGDDSYTINENLVLTVAAGSGVLDNDSDADGDSLAASVVSGPANGSLTLAPDGSFEYTPDADWHGVDQFTYEACDSEALCSQATVSITVIEDQVLGATGDSVGLVDVTTGMWYLRDPQNGQTTSFYYGVPGDLPMMGDWDCDGVDTPGLYRQSDGFVYLRNSNTQGVGEISFFFGIAGDIPIAGDFDGDGCDTVSIYRASEGKAYIINELGKNGGGLGFAEYSFYFGVPGDNPFVGDFDDDGTDTLGLHRESSGFLYFRNSNTGGVADAEFFYGIPGDILVAGNWAQIRVPGPDTVAVFRPSEGVVYLKFDNAPGVADISYQYGNSNMRPVSGHFGKLPGGDPSPPG